MVTSCEGATELLRRLRSEGTELSVALDQMRGRGFGIIPVMKALREVEGINLREAADLLEERGDAKQF